MNDPIPVYVVVVTYNAAKWITRLLSSLSGSRYRCFPVIVDNASTDSTVQIVESGFPEVKIIRQETNLGFGAGNNIGIAYSLKHEAEFIFLLNQDAYVLVDTLGQLVEFMRTHPQFGVVSPLHCGPSEDRVDGGTQQNYLQQYVPSYLSDACLNRVQTHYSLRGVNAAAWLVRREAFERIGGFDPLFFMYGEDDDMINRFEYHNIGFAILPSARIVHLRERAPVSERDKVGAVKAVARRARSSLLIDLKGGKGGVLGKFRQLITNGLLRPLVDFIESRDIKRFVGEILASLQLMVQVRRVLAHSRKCRDTGPHFLFDD